MTRRTEVWLTALLVLAAAGVVATRVLWPGDRPEAPQDDPSVTATDLPPADELGRWYAAAHEVGSTDGPVRIIEFGSFRCKFCGDLYWAIDSIQARYPGLISVRWLHLVDGPVDAVGTEAYTAHAAECAADQGRFPAFYHATFRASRPPVTRADHRRLAEVAAVADLPRFEACLDTGALAEVVAQHRSIAASQRFPGTPGWFFNGQRIIGAVTATVLDSMVRAVIRPPNRPRY